MIILVTGGARSGKSSFAERIALKMSEKKVYYLATAEAKDEEMVDRIKRHKEARPDNWETLEEPYYVGKVLNNLPAGSVVLLDCITLLVSNLILKFDKDREEKIMEEIQKIVDAGRNRELKLIIVTNEVGQGVVPPSELGREYRDTAGRVNQLLGREADRVYLTVAGLPLEIKEEGKRNLQKYNN